VRSPTLSPPRAARATTSRLIGLLVATGLAAGLAGCGSRSGSNGQASGAASSGGSRTVQVKLAPADCDPATLRLPAGATTFQVSNDRAAAVTEFEVLDAAGTRILGEVENLAPGLHGHFSLNLNAGSYRLKCPGGTAAATGTLTITGTGSAAAGADPQLTEAATRYQADLRQQAGLLVERTGSFVGAVLAGDLAAAKERYPAARAPYERIEPVAESFGDQDPAIDARQGDVPASQWTGFHVLERALWQQRSLAGTAPVARKLLSDVKALQARIAALTLDAPQIANGANELLTEVSSSKITGEEERYSHLDLVDISANLEGSQAAFALLRPALARRDATLASQITQRFNQVRAVLAPWKRGAGFVAYTSLSTADTRRLSQALDAVAEPLSQVGAKLTAAAPE
jgi:iron uptake system component EfeO